MNDCWDSHLDVGMPDAILSYKVVAAREFSHNCVTKKETNKLTEKLRILSSIRDQRTKKQ